MARDDNELVVCKSSLKQTASRSSKALALPALSNPAKWHNLIANGTVIKASHILVATGRRPVIDGLNLPAAGVKFDKISIMTDRRLRTSNKRIYAIGDVTGRQQFTIWPAIKQVFACATYCSNITKLDETRSMGDLLARNWHMSG